MRTAFCLAVILLCSIGKSFAQKSDSLLDRIADFPGKFFNKIDSKTSHLDDQLTDQTIHYLQRLERKEQKLKKKLLRSDSASAAKLFNPDPEKQYEAYIAKMKGEGVKDFNSMGPEYLPYVDSLKNVVSFLNKNSQLLNNTKVLPADIQNSLGKVEQLGSKMEDADQIKQFIQGRKNQINEYLKQFLKLPPGIAGAFDSYKKEAYYYSQQVKEYRETLNDPDKMLKTALNLLNKIPAFSSFMKQNGFLAGLFGVPGNYGTAQGLEGLQTRDQILSMIQAQVGQGGPNATATIQQNLQAAQQDINNLRDKLSKLGGGSGDIDMPKFKPNNEKTKTFFKRLEYGANIQTERADYFFPTTTDLAFSVGYKVSDKNTIGIGASYKVGWGSGINHVNVTSEGAGLRSFFDLQMKKSFYASGGYELNYQQPFNSFLQIANLSSWQQSGLIGLSKIVSMNTKVLKKTRIQLLWDFLSYYQLPRTNPIKFRVGYNF